MISKRVICLSAVAAWPMLAGAAAARAQTPSAAATGQPPQLEEIVVTAQKRGENVQRVPISMTVASGAALVAQGVTNTLQLNVVVPSLTIRTTTGAFQPYIRGIGTASNVVESPVALYIDGVYLPQQREGLRELNDIEQIAVLKGPQGTLFGRNATGGVIQITTRAPSHTFGGEVGIGSDNYGLVKADAYLTGPLDEHVAFSLSGQYASQAKGWGKDFATGNDTYRLREQISLRGKLLYEPGPDTKITLIADYLKRKALGNSFQPLPGTHFSIPGFGPTGNRYDTYSGFDSTIGFEGGGGSLTVDQNIGFAHLVSISAYRRGEGNYRFNPAADPAVSFIVESPNSPNEMFSEELQLVSKPGRFNWVAGVFYFHNRNESLPIVVSFFGPLAPAPASLLSAYRLGTELAESVAPFAQANWEFLPGTTLTGGARWTYERRTADLSQVLTFNSGFVVRPPAVNGAVLTIREPTFRAAVTHDFTHDILGYVSFNTGIKSGGFNILNPGNPAYLPEKLKSYEAGVKMQLLDRRLRLNLASYYYDYTNVQVTRFSGGAQVIDNGAAAKLYGLDVDFEAQLTASLRLSGGAALEHTSFTSYPGAIFGVQQPNGSVVLTPGDAKGNRLPLAQQVSGTLAVDYHRDLARGAIDADVTGNYNGDYYFEADNFLRQKPFVVLNTSVKYTLPGERISFMIWGKNLLDEAILSFPITQTFGYDANYNAPRTYGVSARMKF